MSLHHHLSNIQTYYYNNKLIVKGFYIKVLKYFFGKCNNNIAVMVENHTSKSSLILKDKNII